MELSEKSWSCTLAGTHYVIPGYMRDGIERYVNEGFAVGDFLTAVFSNRLVSALSHADDQNIRNIPAYANLLYNYVPSKCWGSWRKVQEWQSIGGLVGLRKLAEEVDENHKKLMEEEGSNG